MDFKFVGKPRDQLFTPHERQLSASQDQLFFKMPKSGSEASEDFEYVETPAAAAPAPPAEDYGVRTTTVN